MTESLRPVNVILLNFFFFEREKVREHTQMHGGRVEGDGERILSRPHAQQAAQHGVDLTNPEIMTSAEIKSQRLNGLSHPGAPPLFLRNFFLSQ